MSEGGKSRRSARIANKRLQTGGDESKPKRMKPNPSSRTPPSANSFDAKLRDVFSFRAAIPVLDDYLSSIKIDDDNPGFLFDWEVDNVTAFVNAMNGLDVAQAPVWLRTRPITAQSFIDDLVHRLQPLAGGRCGRVLLAPNTQQQFGAILATLIGLQNHTFLQTAAQVALPVDNNNNAERYLVTTYYLAETKAQQSHPNNLQPTFRDDLTLRRLFI
ncbi:hypothetical protein PHYBOEH_002588 [Phytophthora boehmeriae]|uniref:Uncharacterized protein n=1 Tax=Phytophthora boehmeriae TaxID=109152 RepID=A0A8T1V757_9STRA|nr:hypothetical protein PHYBOEH_002588 [Phytophthora boehmeriae]